MCTVVVQESVRIPAEVVDLASFRRWIHSDAAPERGRISFLDGEVWVDMSPEGFLHHNQVKGEISRRILNLLDERPLGRFFHDGTLITHPEAQLSTEPDAAFVTWESLESGRVRPVLGVADIVEFEGPPDLVLEVVSPSSTKKDNVVLRRLYHRAGVPEFWLVDVRGERLTFQILRRRDTDYEPVEAEDGWAASPVLGRSFRLVRGEDRTGAPVYTLESRGSG